MHINRTRVLPILLLLLFSITLHGQNMRVEPPFWWAGMKSSNLQILVHQQNIAASQIAINHTGIMIDTVIRTGNPNYLFINLSISPELKSAKFDLEFRFSGKKKPILYPYELKERTNGSAQRQGFGESDIIYMLMPDRFANGDTLNDNRPGMLEKANRNNPDGRHGGDIAGLIQNLDYFSKTLGVTAVWINPLVENNMPAYSYHGYAATDFYRIDPRFGSNEDYRKLSEMMEQQGLKLISDMVFNHCGLNHWWMKDLPTETWIHQFPEFTRSNYRAEALMDPYASAADRKEMHSGWFDNSMPDLNQNDSLLARYLIQNSIWWIEYTHLSGIRMDTWPYADAGFLNRWLTEIKTEYPNFSILGETWLQKEAHTAYFQQNHLSGINPASRLEFLTDFPLSYAINRAFNEKDSWTSGMASLYYVIAQDFLYSRPDRLCIFLDNHDVMRFFTNQKESLQNWELGMTYLFTSRGIPVIYYGTEILMPGDKGKGDADLRRDFPGGWHGDSVNAFINKGLSPEQTYALNKTRELIFLRKGGLINRGRLIHYIPRDGVYVYGWIGNGQNLMVMLNNNDVEINLDPNRFTELRAKQNKAIDLSNGREVELDKAIIIPPKKSLIYHIQP
jgi:neopullulanase